MKINEVIQIDSFAKEMPFIREIRTILGTEHLPLPKFTIVPLVTGRKAVLGACTWQFQKPITIEIKKHTLNHLKTFERTIAHELCHEAEYLLYWESLISTKRKKMLDLLGRMETIPEDIAKKIVDDFRKFVTKVNTNISKNTENHGKRWQGYANKVNAVYGKDYVTAHSDDSYILEK